MASFIGPPDPFSKLVNIGLGILLFLPAVYVSVADSGDSWTLLTFYGAIRIVILLGVFLVEFVDGGHGFRLGVLLVVVVAGTLVADGIG